MHQLALSLRPANTKCLDQFRLFDASFVIYVKRMCISEVGCFTLKALVLCRMYTRFIPMCVLLICIAWIFWYYREMASMGAANVLGINRCHDIEIFVGSLDISIQTHCPLIGATKPYIAISSYRNWAINQSSETRAYGDCWMESHGQIVQEKKFVNFPDNRWFISISNLHTLGVLV